MNEARLLGWSALNRLFTILLCLDDEGNIVFASDVARRHIKLLETRNNFFEIFKLLRPVGPRDMQELRKHLNSLFLIKAVDDSFAVRGQMLETQFGDQALTCFCGAPWLFWINANRPNLKLQMGDFSAQDSQLDQLFLMTTEQRMVGDLESLNTELKRAKRETERAQEAKNALFARMSHEMRTPLNGVVSALALLSDKPLTEETRALLELAESSSRNLLHVINYVLDISKIEAGDEVLESQPLLLESLLKGVTDIVRARAVEKGIALDWEVAQSLAPAYLGDRDKLRQCLLNLVTNAIRFTPSGGVVLRALPAQFDHAGGVRFEVQDTGIGISEEDRQRIFEPFWTKSDNDQEGTSGTGLGLDIVRRNTEIMGGSLGLHSRVGEGSLFWLELPLSPTAAPDSTVDEPHPDTVPLQRVTGQVLLVDDNSTNLLLGRMILESIGLSVTTAVNGAEAISLALTSPQDLILMDINMPVMDGIEATARIRERLDGSELPILALTAYTSAEEKERCLKAGMNDYLSKPIVRDRLIEKLLPWLGRESRARSAQGTGGPAHAPASIDSPVPAAGEAASDYSFAVLEDLRSQIGDAGLHAVVGQFEAEARSRCGAFLAARKSEDSHAATREAHTLASTCKSLGLVGAGERFATIEQTLRRQAAIRTEDCLAAIESLENGLALLKENLAS